MAVNSRPGRRCGRVTVPADLTHPVRAGIINRQHRITGTGIQRGDIHPRDISAGKDRHGEGAAVRAEFRVGCGDPAAAVRVGEFGGFPFRRGDDVDAGLAAVAGFAEGVEDGAGHEAVVAEGVGLQAGHGGSVLVFVVGFSLGRGSSRGG
jgi:hypothetical protein